MDCREHEHRCNFWMYKFHISQKKLYREEGRLEHRLSDPRWRASMNTAHTRSVFSGTRWLAVGLDLEDWSCSRVSNRCSVAFGSVLTELFYDGAYYTAWWCCCFLSWAYAYQSDFYLNAGTLCSQQSSCVVIIKDKVYSFIFEAPKCQSW